MINFTNRRRSADFGSLGAGEDFDSKESKDARGANKGDKEKGDNDILGVAKEAAGLATMLGGGSGGLCGCANKDKEAEDKKKSELQEKYPLRNCGPSPTPECTAYNKKMLQLQEDEFKMWQENKDAQVADAVPPSEKEKFGFVAELARELKARHPEAGGMTLSQIYKKFPDDFDKAYAKLGAKYPFLKTMDPQTALAMAPGVAKMTLDELIKKTSTLAGGMGRAPSPIKAGGAGMLLAAAAVVGALWWKSRQE